MVPFLRTARRFRFWLACLVFACLEMVGRVGWSIPVGAVWSPLIVESAPTPADDACFTYAVEDFRIEHLRSVGSVEALAGAILPGLAWFDIRGLRATLGEPFLQGFGNEFRAVVRS